MKTRFQTLFTTGAAALTCALLATFAAPGGASESAAPSVAAYDIDSGHSGVVFRTKHLGVAYFYGTFNDVKGSFSMDADDPSKSSIQIEIKADSIDTNSEQRDGHLKSPDFLAAKEFPVIKFESTKVKKKGDGMAVTGDLTLHGVTKEVTAEVELVGAGETYQGYKAGFVADFTIDMTDFEMSYVQSNPGALGPEVDLTVSIEGLRK